MRERLEMAGVSSSFLLPVGIRFQNWDWAKSSFTWKIGLFIDEAVACFTIVAVPSSLPSYEIFCTPTRWESDQIRSDQSLGRVRLFATPWIAACQGLPVHHQLPEFTQTHVHRKWKHDNIKPMWFSKSRARRESHSNTSLLQETRKIPNKQPNFTPKAARKITEKHQS